MTELCARGNTGGTTGRHAAEKPPSRLAHGALQTLPLLLAGSMAMTFGLATPDDASNLKRDDKPKDSHEQLHRVVIEAMNAASSRLATERASATAASATFALSSNAPRTYRVVGGDTVSAIAARFGLSTASVLALNGLGWNSLIFPGQVLVLSKAPSAAPAPPPPVPNSPPSSSSLRYTIASGDTVSAIARRYGVSTQAVLTANNLGWSTLIYPGQRIVIPKATAATPPPSASAPAPSDAPDVSIIPVVDVTPIESAPETAPPAPETPVPAPQKSTYRIVSGDTVTSIAARYGVSIQSILDANGLTRSSIIYAGRTLIIPGVASAPASVSTGITPLTAEMAANARTIIAVGRSLGVSDYGLVIALAAAMQESSLRNLNYGDRDSLGLFQQRPSTGWGTPAQVTDPVYASKLFFGGPSNPNRGNTRGLLDIAGWQTMSVTHAAQAVQLSAYPNAYAKWESSARAWLAQLG